MEGDDGGGVLPAHVAVHADAHGAEEGEAVPVRALGAFGVLGGFGGV